MNTKIVCVSASNVRHAKNGSTSTRLCCMIREMILQELHDHATVDIIPLVDYELKPCIGCGECSESAICVHDKVFNNILSFLTSADGIVRSIDKPEAIYRLKDIPDVGSID